MPHQQKLTVRCEAAVLVSSAGHFIRAVRAADVTVETLQGVVARKIRDWNMMEITSQWRTKPSRTRTLFIPPVRVWALHLDVPQHSADAIALSFPTLMENVCLPALGQKRGEGTAFREDVSFSRRRSSCRDNKLLALMETRRSSEHSVRRTIPRTDAVTHIVSADEHVLFNVLVHASSPQVRHSKARAAIRRGKSPSC